MQCAAAALPSFEAAVPGAEAVALRFELGMMEGEIFGMEVEEGIVLTGPELEQWLIQQGELQEADIALPISFLAWRAIDVGLSTVGLLLFLFGTWAALAAPGAASFAGG